MEGARERGVWPGVREILGLGSDLWTLPVEAIRRSRLTAEDERQPVLAPIRNGLNETLALAWAAVQVSGAGLPASLAAAAYVANASLEGVDRVIRSLREMGLWDELPDPVTGGLTGQGWASRLGGGDVQAWARWGMVIPEVTEAEVDAVAGLVGLVAVPRVPEPPPAPGDFYTREYLGWEAAGGEGPQPVQFTQGYVNWLESTRPFEAFNQYQERRTRLRGLLRVVRFVASTAPGGGPVVWSWVVGGVWLTVSAVVERVREWRASGVWPAVAHALSVDGSLGLARSLGEVLDGVLPDPGQGFRVHRIVGSTVVHLRDESVTAMVDGSPIAGGGRVLRLVVDLDGPLGPQAAVLAAVEFLQRVDGGWGVLAELELRRSGGPIPEARVSEVAGLRGLMGQGGPVVVRHDRVAPAAGREPALGRFVYRVNAVGGSTFYELRWEYWFYPPNWFEPRLNRPVLPERGGDPYGLHRVPGAGPVRYVFPERGSDWVVGQVEGMLVFYPSRFPQAFRVGVSMPEAVAVGARVVLIGWHGVPVSSHVVGEAIAVVDGALRQGAREGVPVYVEVRGVRGSFWPGLEVGAQQRDVLGRLRAGLPESLRVDGSPAAEPVLANWALMMAYLGEIAALVGGSGAVSEVVRWREGGDPVGVQCGA